MLTRCIHVRSRDPDRVFNSVTHQAKDGSGPKKLTLKKGKEQVPASMLVLLSVLNEEYRAKTKIDPIAPDQEQWIDPDAEEPVTGVYTIPSDFDRIPRAPPELIFVFDMLVKEFPTPDGPVLRVMFYGLTFSLAQERRHERLKARERLETSGVWRAATKHQGSRTLPGPNKKRATG